MKVRDSHQDTDLRDSSERSSPTSRRRGSRSLATLMILAVVLATLAVAALDRTNHPPSPAVEGDVLDHAPASRRVDARDTLHGHVIPDPYRWLEDMTSEEARKWTRAQDDFTRRTLTAIPGYSELLARLRELNEIDVLGAPVPRGERVFFLRTEADAEEPVLWVRDGDGEPRVLVDGHRLNGWRLGGFVPGPHGRRVAWSAAPRGTGWGEWRIRDVATGRDLPDVIRGVRYGSPVWGADGETLYYPAFEVPEAGRELDAKLENQSVRRHRLGQDGPDLVLFQRPGHPDWIYRPSVTDEGRWLVVEARQGSTPAARVFLVDLEQPDAPARALVAQAEAAYSFLGNHGGRLWFQTDREAPRYRIVEADVSAADSDTAEPEAAPTEARWREVVPEGESTLSFAAVVADRFLLFTLDDAVPELRIHRLDGRFERRLRLPQTGTTFSGFLGRRQDPAAYFTVNSLALPSTPYRLDPQSGDIELFARPASGFDPDRFVLSQVFYRAEDGTSIPMFLAHRKGLDPQGNHPLWLYGYGAYGWPAFPWFQPKLVVWMEQGGVYALPGVRGGGEYGEAWHQAGVRENKLTTVGDFLAAADFLVTEGYTSPSKMVVHGGSASGILAAAALTRRPGLFRAAIVNIPVIDLVRGHHFTGGGYRFPEFGSPEVRSELEAILAYSPLVALDGVLTQRGAIGTEEKEAEGPVAGQPCYPATLVTAGETDETAPPVHAYKLVAALQNAQERKGCSEPVLLRMAWGAGHSTAATAAERPESWAAQLALAGRATGWPLVPRAGDEPPATPPATEPGR